jgi:hypothetical protein
MNFDLTPFPESTRVLFILESPHHEEIKLKIPCCGASGDNMSRIILNDTSTSFGELLIQKDTRIKKYGVMNSFSFPIGIDNTNMYSVKGLNGIKSLYDNTASRKKNFENHNKFLSNISDKNIFQDYKTRFKSILDNCDKIELLCFCGYISQSMFMHCYDITLPNHKTLTSIKTKNRGEIKILFINHPRNHNWEYNIKNHEQI